MKDTSEISFSIDYMPAKLLEMAIIFERRFGDIVESCPADEDGMHFVLEEDVINRMFDSRLPSLIMSLSALNAYMSYYGYAYSTEIEGAEPGNKTLSEHLKFPMMIGELEHASRKFINRHEEILDKHGNDTLVKFIRSPLEELDKLFYFPLVKSFKLPNLSDPTVKSLLQLYELRDEVLNPDFVYPLENGEDVEEVELKLKFHVSEEDKSRYSCDSRHVKEFYCQHNQLWEIFHCAPPQTVQDFIRYIHRLDESKVHFMAFMYAQRERDENGKIIKEERPKYVIKIG